MRVRLAIPVAATILVLAGCAGWDRVAPSADVLREADPELTVSDAAVLARGRDLYVNRCPRCHKPLPVRDYDTATWERILPDMADKTRLEEAERRDLRRYVDAVLALPADR